MEMALEAMCQPASVCRFVNVESPSYIRGLITIRVTTPSDSNQITKLRLLPWLLVGVTGQSRLVPQSSAEHHKLATAACLQ